MKTRNSWKETLSRFVLRVGIFFVVFVGLAGAAVGQSEYVIRKDDTLSTLFGKRAKAICEFNRLADCNRIFPGMKLAVPSFGTKPRTAACIRLGAEPFNPDGELERTLQGIDLLMTLTAQQKAIAKQKVMRGERASKDELVGTQVFSEMVYRKRDGKIRHVFDKPVCTLEQGGEPEVMDTYDLGDGVYFALPRRCGNPSVFHRGLPSHPILSQAPETVAEQPSLEAPIELAIEEVSAPQEQFCDMDPRLVVGAEIEPRRTGNDARSTFVSAALYCKWRGKTGWHGVGGAGQASWWDGHVDHGKGRFEGNLYGIGPAYAFTSDYHWDVELRALLFGRYRDTFEEGLYQQDVHANASGPSVVYNNYQRRMRGEKWLPEIQLFGSAFLLTNTRINQKWNGSRLDSSNSTKPTAVLNAGARLWLYDDHTGTMPQPYIQGGLFAVTPNLSTTCSLRVGIADPNRVIGVGVGADCDLKNGGQVSAAGIWIDVVKGIRLKRDQYRLEQISDEIDFALEDRQGKDDPIGQAMKLTDGDR